MPNTPNYIDLTSQQSQPDQYQRQLMVRMLANQMPQMQGVGSGNMPSPAASSGKAQNIFGQGGGSAPSVGPAGFQGFFE